MEKLLKHTAYLFSCGARNIAPEADAEYNVEKIMKAAIHHSVYPMVFTAVKSLYDRKLIEIPEEMFGFYYNQFFSFIMRKEQIIQTGLSVIDEFEKNGINCCILKGEAISHIYPNKECRICSDVDFLIDPSKENKAMRLLKKMGAEISERKRHSHHFEATLGGVGLEVHIKLYNENFRKLWFSDCAETTGEFITFKADGGREYKSLNVNDNMKFVSLHAIKHFIGGGAGLRQIMDVLLFMNYHYDEIDWEDFWDFMRRMKFEKLLHYFIGIGREYFMMDDIKLPEAQYDKDSLKSFAIDVFESGVFGQNLKSRQGFIELYSMALIKERKINNPEKYLKNNFGMPLKRRIFPLYNDLVNRYPYIKKNRKLLYVAWVHRWFDLVVAVFCRKKSVKSLHEVTVKEDDDVLQKRMDLMRKLDVL